ncbi:hypothetical protein HQ560_02125, partial [bacterium]|nr:hypothetical protein [bacterium]
MRTLSRRLTVTVLLSLAACLVFSATAQAAAPAGPIVREVTVRGVTGDPAAITDIIKTKVGAPLNSETILEDTQRLRDAGYLANFRMQTVANGVRIIIQITPPPRIQTLTVTGTGKTWDKRLKDELLTKQGSIVLPAMLRLPEAKQFLGDKKRILAYVTERGYRAAKVVAATTQTEGSDAIGLTFTVDLGPKYQVTKMRFEGNASLSTKELKARMQTKKDGWFSSHRYSDEIFEEDMYGSAGVQQYYRYKGFPNAKATYTRNFTGGKGNRVHLVIRIEEGKQYPVASVSVSGNKAIDSETLLKAVLLKAGHIYSDEKFLQASSVIERLYKKQGYPEVKIKQPAPQLNAAGDAYDVAFAVEDGERITIGRVRTRGNVQTRQDVIFRELEMQPGMTYDIRKIERSERALNRLGFFDTVTLDLVPTDPPDNAERDLLVSVEEGHTGMFRFGAGYSTTNEVVGAIDLTQRNFDWRRTPKRWADLFSGNAFTGAGQFFRIALMPGNVYSNYLVQYENPYWKHHEDGRNESFGWSVYYRTRDQGEWDETRAGLRLSRGLRKYKGDPDTDLIWHVRVEGVDVGNVDAPEEEGDDGAPEGAIDDEGSNVLLGFGPRIVRDR